MLMHLRIYIRSAETVYIRRIYGLHRRDYPDYMAYIIRFWPTLHIHEQIDTWVLTLVRMQMLLIYMTHIITHLHAHRCPLAS